MLFDFDGIIDRRNTNSIKYDFYLEKGKPENALPLWVADMDFRTAPVVTEALTKAVQFGIYGYSESRDSYFNALQSWYLKYFDLKLERPWLVKTPGVVFALYNAIRAFTEPGDSIMIQRPVYYPFTHAILDNGRNLVNNPLIDKSGKYTVDFDDFERKIQKNQVKLFILSNPHNPVGRVWSKEELLKMGDICRKYNVIVISDEIHADFIYSGHQHIVFASLKPEFADITVTCTSPSKTFNLAGLQVSNIIITNQNLRRRFRKEVNLSGNSSINIMGLVACEAAYSGGRPWLEELKNYLNGNLDFVRSYLIENIPQVKLVEPEGTYLLWLDFRSLGLSSEQLEDLILNKAKLWLDSGSMFGPEGEGFQRVNIACPRVVLVKALEQLKAAIND